MEACKDTCGPIGPNVFHAPMVAAYEAQSDTDLTHAILSGDHSFSWSRLALIKSVTEGRRAAKARMDMAFSLGPPAKRSYRKLFPPDQAKTIKRKAQATRKDAHDDAFGYISIFCAPKKFRR